MPARRAWQRWRRSVVALPLVALGVLVVALISEIGYHQTTDGLQSLTERGNARLELQTLLRRLIDAESGQRGYLLTGRREYLDPYRSSVEAVGSSLDVLHAFYGREAGSREALRLLAERVRTKLSEMTTTLALYDEGKHQQWLELLLSNLGKEQMDEIREAAESLSRSEGALVAEERAQVTNIQFASRIGVHVMAMITLVALFVFLRTMRVFDRAIQAERDQLESEVGRRTADLSELARHLETAREDERAHLARELHDELGALLTAAKLDAARLRRSLEPIPAAADERLRQLAKALDEGIALKRRIIEDLRPSSLANLGLVAALDILGREFAKRAELKVSTRMTPVRLAPDAEITAYRLVQETLTNVARHAKASNVSIELGKDGDRVRIAVRDDGVGFVGSATRRGAHGLLGMRHRVASVGGSLSVTSAPGAGTLIEAWLPGEPLAAAVVAAEGGAEAQADPNARLRSQGLAR
jgi:signal transduction histidine kinase